MSYENHFFRGDINSIKSRGIYEDLLREFVKNRHHVYIVSPTERWNGEQTHIIKERGCRILKVKTGNIQKTNLIEKGIANELPGESRQFIKVVVE